MKALPVLGLMLALAGCSRHRQSGAADSQGANSSYGSGGRGPGVAATDTPPAAGKVPGVTTPDKASINGVAFGAHEEDVRRLLGQPDSTTHSARDGAIKDSTTNLHYKGLTAILDEGQVVGIRCAGTDCTTGDGVRVGSSAAEVERAYGPAGRSGGSTQLTYGFTTDGKCALRFAISANVVKGIEVTCK
jgi:hypothetical protein